jgi:hypothetical protein
MTYVDARVARHPNHETYHPNHETDFDKSHTANELAVIPFESLRAEP